MKTKAMIVFIFFLFAFNQISAFDKGGYILADDMIIRSDGEKTLYLIEPDPAGFKVLAQAELLDTKQSWAPLALSNEKLIIRDQKQMKCVVVK